MYCSMCKRSWPSFHGFGDGFSGQLLFPRTSPKSAKPLAHGSVKILSATPLMPLNCYLEGHQQASIAKLQARQAHQSIRCNGKYLIAAGGSGRRRLRGANPA